MLNSLIREVNGAGPDGQDVALVLTNWGAILSKLVVPNCVWYALCLISFWHESFIFNYLFYVRKVLYHLQWLINICRQLRGGIESKQVLCHPFDIFKLLFPRICDCSFLRGTVRNLTFNCVLKLTLKRSTMSVYNWHYRSLIMSYYNRH